MVSGKPIADPSGLPTIQIELARACSRRGNQRFTREFVIENCGPSAIPKKMRQPSIKGNDETAAITAITTPQAALPAASVRRRP